MDGPPMTQSSRLVGNSVINFVKLALVTLFTLLTQRILLDKLGFEQFGIFAGISAIGMFGAMLGQALLGAAQRNLAFEVGREDKQQVILILRASEFGFLLLACLFSLGAIGLQPWLFHALEIPDHVSLAYIFVILYTCGLLMAGPATAMLLAQQQFLPIAFMQVGLQLGMFAGAVYIQEDGIDNLTTYAFLVALTQALITCYAVIISRKFIASSQISNGSARQDFFRLGDFFFWNLLGYVAAYLRTHGSLVASFSIFGATSAAAYEVSLKVTNFQKQAGYSITQVVYPAITIHSSRSSYSEVETLALLSSKYACLACLFLTVPVLVDAELILSCWLGEYPEQAPLFARILSATALISFLVEGHGLASAGRGNIALPTIISSSCELLIVGATISFVLLNQDSPEFYIPSGGMVAMAIVVIFYVYILGDRLNIPPGLWLSKVLVPVSVVAILSTIVSLLLSLSVENPWLSLAWLGCITSLSIACFSWFLATDKAERVVLREAFLRTR